MTRIRVPLMVALGVLGGYAWGQENWKGVAAVLLGAAAAYLVYKEDNDGTVEEEGRE